MQHKNTTVTDNLPVAFLDEVAFLNKLTLNVGLQTGHTCLQLCRYDRYMMDMAYVTG